MDPKQKIDDKSYYIVNDGENCYVIDSDDDFLTDDQEIIQEIIYDDDSQDQAYTDSEDDSQDSERLLYEELERTKKELVEQRTVYATDISNMRAEYESQLETLRDEIAKLKKSRVIPDMIVMPNGFCNFVYDSRDEF